MVKGDPRPEASGGATEGPLSDRRVPISHSDTGEDKTIPSRQKQAGAVWKTGTEHRCPGCFALCADATTLEVHIRYCPAFAVEKARAKKYRPICERGGGA